MNKKTIGVSIIISVLLIAIVSAGLIDYFGKIEGSVVVEGPVFYLDDNPKELVLNEAPSISEIVYNITNEEVFFIYQDSIDELYLAEFSIFIPQKADNSGNKLNFSIIKYNSENYELICSGLTKDSTTGSFKVRSIVCQSDGEISFNAEEKLGLMISDIPENINSSYIRISTYQDDGTKYPRIEISKATT